MTKPKIPRLAASQSFTAEEVAALDTIVSSILRGGDARHLQRTPQLAALARKAKAMKATVERAKEARANPERVIVAKTEAPAEDTSEPT